MKKKNWILGIAPLLCLAYVLGNGFIPDIVRIVSVVLAIVFFATYILITVRQRIRAKNKNG